VILDGESLMSKSCSRQRAEETMAEDHGWIDTDKVVTSLGTFEFNGGYPSEASAKRLQNLRTLNRAMELFLDQMLVVSWYHVWKGATEWGPRAANQLVIWQGLMDPETLLPTGNSETVYAIAGLDLKRDGPVVIELPPMLLGDVADFWQDEVAAVGPTGIDKGQGGKLLLLPPSYQGDVPQGYMVSRATSYRVVLGVRRGLVDGKSDHAVGLMRSLNIYPLSAASTPPAMTHADVSHTDIDTIFRDGSRLDGGSNYRLHYPPDIPLKDVLVDRRL
jgi:hypothetical protein